MPLFRKKIYIDALSPGNKIDGPSPEKKMDGPSLRKKNWWPVCGEKIFSGGPSPGEKKFKALLRRKKFTAAVAGGKIPFRFFLRPQIINGQPCGRILQPQ